MHSSSSRHSIGSRWPLQSTVQQQSVEIASLQNSVFSAYAQVQYVHDVSAAAGQEHDAAVAELTAQHELAQQHQHAELAAVQTILQSMLLK